MEMRPYLKNGNRVSRLGFSTAALGENSENDDIALIKAAFNQGINFFETAPHYGDGNSEAILGKALERIREQVVITTKITSSDENDTHGLRPGLEESLKRLRTDYIDTLLLYKPDPELLNENSEHLDMLETMKKEGLINSYGVSIDSEKALKATLENTNVDVIELKFNVFFQSGRNHLDAIKKRGIALVLNNPLDSGWLTGNLKKKNPENPDDSKRVELVERMKRLLGDHDLTPHALGFLWTYEPVTSVVPAIKNADELIDNSRASGMKPNPNLKTKLEEFYDHHLADDPIST